MEKHVVVWCTSTSLFGGIYGYTELVVVVVVITG